MKLKNTPINLIISLILLVLLLIYAASCTSNTTNTTNSINENGKSSNEFSSDKMDKLTIQERQEQLNKLKGKDITIGELLEKVFPEMLEDMDKAFIKRAYEIKFDWNDTWAQDSINALRSDPNSNLFLFLPDSENE